MSGVPTEDAGLPPRTAHIEGRELPDEDVVVPELPRRSTVVRLVAVVAGVGLFVIALGLMRAGATELIPALRGSVFTDNAWSTLGLGWLGSCILLAGSPVSVSALSLLDAGAIDRSLSFAMVAGSRLGAAFVVLVVGVVYALRRKGGGGRRAPISIGILSLLMTFLVYVPAAAAGMLLLDGGAFDRVDIGTPPAVTSATDVLFGWVTDALTTLLPDWAVFLAGIAFLLAGFRLIDEVMPRIGSDRMATSGRRWRERKWPMFLVGCGVTLLTLSVAVSLTLLVPLVAKGHIRRANALPYIAGANITTLADTLLAAILLGNQDAVRVVSAMALTVSVWTIFLLAAAYPPVRAACLAVARIALASPRRLAVFSTTLLAVPLVLIGV